MMIFSRLMLIDVPVFSVSCFYAAAVYSFRERSPVIERECIVDKEVVAAILAASHVASFGKTMSEDYVLQTYKKFINALDGNSDPEYFPSEKSSG